MKRVLVWFLLCFGLGWSTVVTARTLTETSFTNVNVTIYHDKTGATRVQVQGDAVNGATTPRRVLLDLTAQLTAGQLATASNAFNAALGALGTSEGVPTPVPTSTP